MEIRNSVTDPYDGPYTVRIWVRMCLEAGVEVPHDHSDVLDLGVEGEWSDTGPYTRPYTGPYTGPYKVCTV